MPGRTGDGASVWIDLEVALGQPSLTDRRLGDRCEYGDAALGQLAPNRAVAVRGVTEQPVGTTMLGLLID